MAILTTARELDSQFEWAAHEPEALGGGISREIIEIIKHRKDTNGLDEADAIVIELVREIFRREEGSVGDLRPVITPVRRRALRSISLLSWAIMGSSTSPRLRDGVGTDQP